jgi:hypothetical protein
VHGVDAADEGRAEGVGDATVAGGGVLNGDPLRAGGEPVARQGLGEPDLGINPIVTFEKQLLNVIGKLV